MPNENHSFTIIPHTEYQRMPWKNGLGETLEIAIKQQNGEVLYRVSQASVVEDGLFSDFSGLHRTLVLLKGNGMLLKHQSQSGVYQNKLTELLSIALFSGGDITHATLCNGAVDDLNVMVRNGKASSHIEAMLASDVTNFECSPDSLFSGFYANSACELLLESGSNYLNISVKSQDTVLIHHMSKVTVRSGSGVAINIISS